MSSIRFLPYLSPSLPKIGVATVPTRRYAETIQTTVVVGALSKNWMNGLNAGRTIVST